MDVVMKSPTGDEIQGTYDLVPGSCFVNFTQDGDKLTFDHAGDTKMHWDGSETQKINDVPFFTDESGQDWLQHHLIPDDAQPLSIETIDTFNAEIRIGQALEAARKFQKSLESIAAHGDTRTVKSVGIAGLLIMLTEEYVYAMQRSIAVRAAELAAQPADAEEEA